MSQKQKTARRWRLVQLEPAVACNLKCVMCPWRDIAHGLPDKGLMPVHV